MASNSIVNNLWGACNKMRQDPGTTGALQYIQQFSWLLFLKVFEETERKRQTECELEAKEFKPNLSEEYTWSSWAYNKDLTGATLISFVNDKLFPYLRSLKANKTQQTIANIFNNSVNLMQDGYLLKEAIEKIRDTDFFSDDESFAISEVYEGLFSKMKASDLKPLAEFYTPRPIGKFMTQMVNPEIGETVYDPANGPSGFLVEAFYVLKGKAKSGKDVETLHERSLYGKEVKPLPYVLGMMNLILNGVEAPNITKTNTLGINLFQLTEKDRYNVVLANPPFSGQLKGVSSNFPYPASATEILFLQHAMRSLKQKGRCAIIFPEGVLSTTDEKAYVNSKKELLENYNLHSIVRMPEGAFAPYTSISTNILFFDKKGKTDNIWYYEVQPPIGKKNFSKTNPIRFESFAECISLWHEKAETKNSWIIPIERVVRESYNLDFKNPNKVFSKSYDSPTNLIYTLAKKQEGLLCKFQSLQSAIANFYKEMSNKYETVPLSKVLTQYQIKTYVQDKEKYNQLTISKHDGIKLRGFKYGSEIGRKRQFIVDLDKYPNTILYTRQTLQQDEAIGLAPDEVNGCVVTENMPMFSVDGALPLFVHYYFKSSFFLKQLHKSKRKGTSQQTIHEDIFLRYEMPLPSETIQGEIVSLLEEVIELKKRQSEINTDLSHLFPAVLDEAFKSE